MPNTNEMPQGNPYIDLYIILGISLACIVIAVVRGIFDQKTGYSRWWKRPTICLSELGMTAMFLVILRMALFPLAQGSSYSCLVTIPCTLVAVISLLITGLCLTGFYIFPFISGRDIEKFFCQN